MSGLRFFDDIMHAQIAAERRLAEIESNASTYTDRCATIRAAHLPRGNRPAPSFFAATEGLNAARIIIGRAA